MPLCCATDIRSWAVLIKTFRPPCAPDADSGVSPISLRYMEDAFVLSAAPRSTLAKIPLGSTVTEINGLPTGEYLEQEYGRYLGCFTHGRREEKLAEKMLLREAAKELTVSGLTPDGAAFNVTLSYAEYAGKREQLPG